jgi:hypothetical protein
MKYICLQNYTKKLTGNRSFIAMYNLLINKGESNMNIEYSLLENGFDFLICAINNMNCAREDEIDEDARKRLLKYAMLHLSSGIELIFKHRLLNENWTYIFADMNKANKQAFEGGDFKSVDSAGNVERLKNLCDIVISKDEENTLENLRKRPNKIEHFKIKESVESVEAIMCDSLSLVLNFIARYTDLNSISNQESELFEKIKEETLNLEEVVSAREKIIETSAKNDGVYDSLIVCPECLKKYFICDDGQNKCLFCCYSGNPEDVADAYITNVLGISAYSCVKDGGEYPLYECFECGENSMVFDYDKDEAFCFNCGHSIDLSDVEWCPDCGQPFTSYGEDGMTICNSCFNYRVSKDD